MTKLERGRLPGRPADGDEVPQDAQHPVVAASARTGRSSELRTQVTRMRHEGTDAREVQRLTDLRPRASSCDPCHLRSSVRRCTSCRSTSPPRKPQIRQGGGAKAIERQHEKGRLTARERIAKLIDPDTEFFELGLWAAWNMYAEWGGAPSAGVVTGIGTVAGRRVMIIANDATVKAGAFFPMTVQEGAAGPAHRPGEPPAARLPRRFRRRLPAAAGRGLPRRGRLRPHLPQQRRHLRRRASRSSPRSWATASPAAATCRCCATSC